MPFRTEPQRVGAIAAALSAGEMTIGELGDALHSLTAEAVQVLAGVIRTCTWEQYEPSVRLEQASQVCSQIAQVSRIWS